jgi:hypothetical protein
MITQTHPPQPTHPEPPLSRNQDPLDHGPSISDPHPSSRHSNPSLTFNFSSLFQGAIIQLKQDCFANKIKNCSCHTADSKPVKQEVNGTVILPPLVFLHHHSIILSTTAGQQEKLPWLA